MSWIDYCDVYLNLSQSRPEILPSWLCDKRLSQIQLSTINAHGFESILLWALMELWLNLKVHLSQSHVLTPNETSPYLETIITEDIAYIAPKF